MLITTDLISVEQTLNNSQSSILDLNYVLNNKNASNGNCDNIWVLK